MGRLSTMLVVVAFVCGSHPARAQSIAGDWDLVLESPLGAQTVTLTLKQDGEKLSGELANALGAMPVTGTLTGDAMALSAKIALQGLSLQIGLNGKISGDTLTGTAKAGDLAEFPFAGKRKVAGASPAAAPPASAAAEPVAAGSSSLTGPWDVTLVLPGVGEFPLKALLKQDGENVTGTITSALGEVALKGTMVATSLKLTFTTQSPTGPLEIALTGDLAGDELRGKAGVIGLGEAEWKATRGK
jgi:hypothetical protein